MGDTLFVLVGQCGISIGDAFFEAVLARCGKRPPFWTSSTGGLPRAVLIDTERKVARAATAKGSPLAGAPAVVSRAGRGGNWAYGFHGAAGAMVPAASKSQRWIGTGGIAGAVESADDDASVLARALEAIRTEAERSGVHGFVVVHSLAGGTGSGLGARIIRELREAYPTQFLAAVAVAPFRSGENPLQSYNTVLCVASLQVAADMVIVYQNDRVAKLAALTAAAARWTMADVNAIIASSLAGVLMPVEADRGANAGSRNCNLWELCATVCPCPGWKFAQAYSFPVDPESRASSGFAPRTPSSLPFADKLLATVPKFRTDKSPARTIAAQLVLRGFQSHDHELPKLLKAATTSLAPVGWHPFPLDIRYDQAEVATLPSTSAALLANRTDVADPLISALGRSRLMYDVRAYWHWFADHGLEDTDMLGAIETTQSIIDEYADAER